MNDEKSRQDIRIRVYPFWRTLRFRFALWISLFLLVVLLAFSYFVYRSLEHNLAKALDRSLQTNAEQVANLIDWQNTETSLQNTPAQLPNRDITFRIFDTEGNLIYRTGQYQNTVSPSDIFADTLNGQKVYATVPHPFESDENIRLYSAPIKQDGQVIGVVQTIQPLDSVDDPSEQLLILLQIGIPIFVLFVGLGGYVLAGRALAPIDHITTTAAHISTDDLSTRLDLPQTEDEVGRLVKTFNTMLARLEDAFLREKQFTSDASHELRTPLATLRTIAETTLNRPRSAKEYQAALLDVTEEVVQMQTLVQNLLDLAREGRRSVLATHEIVNMSALLEDIGKNMQAFAEAKNLKLILNIQKNLTVQGNQPALTRLFVNLLDNAIKYTVEGEIRLDATQVLDGRIEVKIQDTGTGIAKQHLPHVFERFYRADPSRTTNGTGLGLTLAQTIAQAHHAQLSLESTENIGTTCLVAFPSHTV